MQGELLLFSARELTNEEAGGHGDHWGVFSDDLPEFISHWLSIVIEKSEVPALGLGDKETITNVMARGEPAAFALLYTGQAPGESNAGFMSLFHPDFGGPDQEGGNRLWSTFPFFGDGIAVKATIEQIGLFPNHIEARLQLNLEVGGSIDVFDTLFWRSRSVYRQDESYRFLVSALAYRIEPAATREHVISDEHEIRRFHARDAWAKTYGQWTPDDEEASLAAWHPECPEDLEPIRISMSEMAALMPVSSGPSDDAWFQGEVVRVTPHAVRTLDVDFWRIDAVVMRADEDLVLPIYVAEHLFDGDWRPEVGQYVSGLLWLQAYAAEQPAGSDEHHQFVESSIDHV